MLELVNVAKTIKGKEALTNISFTVDKGSIFGYLGPNGSGKTTTIRIILQLYDNFTGTVKLGGERLNPLMKSHVGFMLESDGFFENMSLRDNLRFYSLVYQSDDNIETKLYPLLMDFDLADSFDDQIKTYSKGMRQKASFIKALMNEPELLILDEPFTGLDPEMQEIMRGHLLRLKSEGVTVFFSSHNLYEVNRLCDKIAIIKDGAIKLEESMDNIRKMGSSPETSLEEVYKDYVK